MNMDWRTISMCKSLVRCIVENDNRKHAIATDIRCNSSGLHPRKHRDLERPLV